MALSETTTPFLWGPNGEAKTPEEIARDREIAEALMRQGVDFSPIASPLQGLARVATAAAGAYRNYQADKAEGANSAANSSMLSNLLGGFGAPAGGGSPPLAGGGLTASDQPPQSMAGVGSPSGVLPASLTAALDKSEGGGDYDTLFSFANKNGPFAGTNVSQMTVGDVMAFTDPSGPYAQFVKKSIGRVATPVGRHQIVGTTLRNAVNEMGIDPSTPFNQGTQDAIAMHLARKRVQSSNTMSGKIAALRNEWEGFKSIPDAQLAQIVQDLEGGRPTQVASADASPWMMDAAPGTGLDDITAENGMQTLPFNPADAANYSVIPIPNATPQDAANYSVQPVKSDRLPNVFVGTPGDYADARVNQAFGTQPGADPQTTGAVPPAQPSVALPYTQEPPAADPAMSSPLVRAILGAESPDSLGPGPFPAAPGPMPQVAPPAAPTRRLPPSAMWRGADQDVAAMGGAPTAAPALQPSAFQAAPASAGGGPFPDAPQAQDGRMAAIIRAITDPSADAYTKRLGFAMLQNQMEAQSPAAQLEMQIKQAQLAKLQQRDRQSLVNAGEGQIYDPNSGQWFSAPKPEGGKFRFEGNSVEAQALNGLMDSGALTPEQAQQLGAGKTITGPNGEIIFMTPQGVFGKSSASSPPVPLSPEQDGAQPAPAPQSTGNIPITAPKVTVDEREAGTFADRLNTSGKIIDDLESAGTDKWDYSIGGNSWIPDVIENGLISEKYQKFDQARRDFINAQLRRESGAVISPEEFENGNRQYFPMPGDTKQTIAQKRANRQVIINGLSRQAGPTYRKPGDDDGWHDIGGGVKLKRMGD